MKQPFFNILRLTLRELRLRLSRPRLWLLFASSTALFCIARPFGTAESLSTAEVVAFWSLLQAACWGVGIVVDALVCVLRPQFGFGQRLALTVAIVAVPIATIVAGLRSAFLDSLFTPAEVLSVLPISAALTLVLAINARLAATPLGDAGGLDLWEAPAPRPAALSTPPPQLQIAAPRALPEPVETPAEPEPPRILDRLPPDRRGPLRRLSMQDHYVEVATDRGLSLLLMRLSDAIAECRPVDGLQVHRSHWVARAAVVSAWRDGDRAMLELEGGERIPVSRARVRALREAGWLPTPGSAPSATGGSNR